jgi:hypothetical protein
MGRSVAYGFGQRPERRASALDVAEAQVLDLDVIVNPVVRALTPEA